MTQRITTTVASFARAFLLEGHAQELPPGDYVVETDEELIEGRMISAYRRVSTTLYVERLPGRPGQQEAWSVDPAILEAALMRDRALLPESV